MKRIVWIAVVWFAVAGLGYGQTTEPHGGGGIAVPGRTEVQETAKTLDRTPGTAPVSFVETEVAPTGARTPAARGGAASSPRAFTARGRVAEATRALPPTEIRKVYKFKLIDPETGAMYGPFPVENGRITVGEKVYKIEVIVYPEEVEKAQKTREQIQLEEKLRRTTIPDLKVEEASLKEVTDFLSREGGVNIVVVAFPERVEDLPQITLTLKNVPFYDVIRYVTEVADLTFRIDDHAVVIKIR